MAASPTTNHRAEGIFQDLRAQIMSDELVPGSRLPSERQLAETFDTNRNTLREAIRKLEQARLVHVRHGQGVTVGDFRRDAAMDVIGPFLRHGADVSQRVALVRDLLRVRSVVIEIVVGFACERAKDEDLARLDAAVDAQLAAWEAGDRQALAERDLAWLDTLVDAAHSQLMRWMANAIFEVYREVTARVPSLWLNEPSFPDAIRTAQAAIRAGDADAARAAMTGYFARNDARIHALLAPVLDGMSGPPTTGEQG